MRAQTDASSFSESVLAYCMKGGEREEDCRRTTEEERHVPDIHLERMSCMTVNK